MNGISPGAKVRILAGGMTGTVATVRWICERAVCVTIPGYTWRVCYAISELEEA